MEQNFRLYQRLLCCCCDQSLEKGIQILTPFAALLVKQHLISAGRYGIYNGLVPFWILVILNDQCVEQTCSFQTYSKCKSISCYFLTSRDLVSCLSCEPSSSNFCFDFFYSDFVVPTGLLSEMYLARTFLSLRVDSSTAFWLLLRQPRRWQQPSHFREQFCPLHVAALRMLSKKFKTHWHSGYASEQQKQSILLGHPRCRAFCDVGWPISVGRPKM